MDRLEGTVAVVTGAAMGIGRSAAQIFAREGAAVVVADIDEVGGRDTVALVEEAGGRVVTAVADVRDAEGLTAVVAEGVAVLARMKAEAARA